MLDHLVFSFLVWLPILLVLDRRDGSVGIWVAALRPLYEIGLVCWRGQTIGKVAAGVIVVDRSMGRVGVGRSSARFAAKTLFPLTLLPIDVPSAYVLVVYPVALLVSIAVAGDHRGWHDRLAGTAVMRVTPHAPLARRFAGASGVGLIPITEPVTGNPRKHRRRR